MGITGISRIENGTRIFAKSMLTGKENTLDVSMSFDKFQSAFMVWQRGMLIQHAFPTLSRSEREFILSGLTDEEYKKLFKEE
jgi:hypothetical protein